jgi:hypothetical protein
MCMPGLPNGIPIEADIHEQYPDELKVAWKTFHNWWKKHFKGEPVYRAKMPPKVAEALEKITNAPIPTLVLRYWRQHVSYRLTNDLFYFFKPSLANLRGFLFLCFLFDSYQRQILNI